MFVVEMSADSEAAQEYVSSFYVKIKSTYVGQ